MLRLRARYRLARRKVNLLLRARAAVLQAMQLRKKALLELQTADCQIQLLREQLEEARNTVRRVPSVLEECERLLELANEMLSRHWVEEYTVLSWRADYRDYRLRKQRANH